MIPKLKQLDLNWFTIGILILYVPFHLIEEALGDFPLWMFQHYQLPKPLSYPHWLINNAVFFIVLLVGWLVYNRNRLKNNAFAIAILMWACMNSMEHIIFSIYDAKVAPGLYTSLLFLLVALLGFAKLKQEKMLKPLLLVQSFLIALAYWLLSFSIIIFIGVYLIEFIP